jgi:hypothetical protein
MTLARSTVLFLGAGASRPFGFPVTAEILPEILRRLGKTQLFRGTSPSGSAPERTDALLTLLRDALPGLFEEGVEVPLVTDLLSLLDHMLLAGHPARPGLRVAELDRLRALLEEAMAEVLSAPMEEGRAAQNAPLLDRLVGWMHGVADSNDRRLSVITTNYDVAIEKRLYQAMETREIPGQVDFGLTWRPMTASAGDVVHLRPPAPRLAFFKLHGSLDWLRCPLCDHIYIDPARTIFRGANAGETGEAGVPQACVCGHAPLRHILVAPSMVRDVRNPNLLSIWQSAFEALRTADEWIVIGYSLPPEDIAIRSMLLRAYRGRPAPPEVTLVERAETKDVENRYRLLLPELRFQSGGVEGFVEGLARI